MAAPLQDSSLRAERSGQRLAVVPRPGFAGQYAKGSSKIERNQYSKGSAMKSPPRLLRSLRLCPPSRPAAGRLPAAAGHRAAVVVLRIHRGGSADVEDGLQSEKQRL